MMWNRNIKPETQTAKSAILPKLAFTALIVLGLGLVVFSYRQRSSADVKSVHEALGIGIPEVTDSPEASPMAALTAKPSAQSDQLALVPNAAEQSKILQEILTSNNDNDPRLDRELRTLDRQAKEQFQTIYRDLPREKRNALGTIVFLLGRNLQEHADYTFLKSVLAEPACHSLGNCNSTSDGSGNKEDQGEMSGVALNYPQVVALRALEKKLVDGEKSSEVREALEVGTHSKAFPVAEKSNALLSEYFKTR